MPRGREFQLKHFITAAARRLVICEKLEIQKHSTQFHWSFAGSLLFSFLTRHRDRWPFLIMIKSKTRDTKPNQNTFFYIQKPFSIATLYPLLPSASCASAKKSDWNSPLSILFCDLKKEISTTVPVSESTIVNSVNFCYQISCVTNEKKKIFSTLCSIQKDLLKILVDLEADSSICAILKFVLR